MRRAALAFRTVPSNSRGGNNSRQKQWTVLISIISVPRERQDEEETVAGVGRSAGVGGGRNAGRASGRGRRWGGGRDVPPAQLKRH